MTGRIHSIQAEDTESFIEAFDQIENQGEGRQIFISRYPQSRLIDLLDISKMQCYWMTTVQDTGVLEPSLEKINHFIESLLRSDSGTIYLEGAEWLFSLHGFDAVQSMIRTLAEKVSISQWSIFISISRDSLDMRERSRFYREAPLFEVNTIQHNVISDDGDSGNIDTMQSASVEMDLSDDGSPKLFLLTRLPRSGFSKRILQRRILQWRRMGLDTSDIEAVLYLQDVDEIYSKYRGVEEQVRRATELEQHVLEHVSDSHERTIALFRIRQLTGLDELERIYFSD